MSMARLSAGLFVGVVLGFSVVPVNAAPPVEAILRYTPKQSGVDYTTPTKAQQANCEVKLEGGKNPGSSGWVLLDGRKKPLRRFFDSDGDKRIDVWSYFRNGLEVYRETDTNRNNQADQYRWFNTGGMRWGIDSNEDGHIDTWKVISADEVAQEAYRAMITRDFPRLKALFITEAELNSLGLPSNYLAAINRNLQNAASTFQSRIAKMSMPKDPNAPARIESAFPHCVPAESIGADQDIYRFPTRTILYQSGKNDHEWLQTGQMIKVGMAWRLTTVPGSTGPMPEVEDQQTPEVRKLLEAIAKLDEATPQTPPVPGPNKAVVDYNTQRVTLIDQLLPKLPAKEREIWLRQKADNLAAVTIHSDSAKFAGNLSQLQQFKNQIVQQMPNSKLAGYVTFRAMWAEYANRLVVDNPKLAKIQAEWLEKLATFVQSYPTADDTPDALLQLAMGHEFAGKEDLAKRYYQQLAENFPSHPLAPKAAGAVRRLDLVGNTMELSGNTLTGQQFNIAALKGRVVAVYYWASYCTICADSFEKLNKLHKEYRGKGFEVVTVNLDDQRNDALRFLQKNPLSGAHLFAPAPDGGLSSPLATQYGIMGLPNLFLVGKDGTVISRTIQINDLEDAIKKAL